MNRKASVGVDTFDFTCGVIKRGQRCNCIPNIAHVAILSRTIENYFMLCLKR